MVDILRFKAKESISDAHDYYKMGTWKTKEGNKIQKSIEVYYIF